MKAAIPTDDGIRVTGSFEKAKGFLILDIESGQLKDVEMIWNKGDYKDSAEKFLNPLTGCEVAFARSFNESLEMMLKQKGIHPVSSPDEIITNLIVHYIENEVHENSDYCCCP